MWQRLIGSSSKNFKGIKDVLIQQCMYANMLQRIAEVDTQSKLQTKKTLLKYVKEFACPISAIGCSIKAGTYYCFQEMQQKQNVGF